MGNCIVCNKIGGKVSGITCFSRKGENPAWQGKMHRLPLRRWQKA
jgi:hypothetical protein